MFLQRKKCSKRKKLKKGGGTLKKEKLNYNTIRRKKIQVLKTIPEKFNIQSIAKTFYANRR